MAGAPDAVDTWDTGVDTGLLKMIGERSVATPESFVRTRAHPRIFNSHLELGPIQECLISM